MTDGNRVRVLVAEDDYLVGEEIRRALDAIGYEHAGLASTGKEAVELVSVLRPDVVLMDIQMPELDGLEAARRIQRDHPTPVVVLTAHESQDLVDEAGKMGVAAYLTKPPRADDIERAVTIAMARHHDLVELRRLYAEVEMANLQVESQNRELEKALAEIKTLRGILPLCSFCKKIRNDEGFWERVDVYFSTRTEAEISHGICPDCMKTHYPEALEDA